MKTSFKTSQSLIKSFATLALMIGPIGSAVGSGVQNPEDPNDRDYKSTGASCDTLPEDKFSLLPTDAIKAIAMNLNPQDLAKTLLVSPKLNEIISNNTFQLDYCGLTQTEYEDLVNVQIPGHLDNDYPGHLDNDYSAQFNEMISGRPLYTFGRDFGRDLSALMAQDNLDLLLATTDTKPRSLLNYIMDLNLDFTKRFAISCYARQLFTEGMDENDRSDVMRALAKLNAEQIFAISLQAHIFFTENMNRYAQSLVITALAPLSVDQISALAQAFTDYEHIFLTENMDEWERSLVIMALSKLSVDQIYAFIQALTDYKHIFFTEDMDEKKRSLVISALVPLSVDQISAFIQAFTDYKHIFFTGKMYRDERTKVMQYLAKLNAEQISVAPDLYISLIREMNTLQSSSAFEYLAPLSVKEIAEVAEVISDLSDPSPKNILQILREKAQTQAQN